MGMTGNRPFPHYAPVNKHKEMRSRLGWTVSYKSLYFVHPSLELVPLFTGMRERSIPKNSKAFKFKEEFKSLKLLRMSGNGLINTVTKNS